MCLKLKYMRAFSQPYTQLHDTIIISLLTKVKNVVERASYIAETAKNERSYRKPIQRIRIAKYFQRSLEQGGRLSLSSIISNKETGRQMISSR